MNADPIKSELNAKLFSVCVLQYCKDYKARYALALERCEQLYPLHYAEWEQFNRRRFFYGNKPHDVSV